MSEAETEPTNAIGEPKEDISEAGTKPKDATGNLKQNISEAEAETKESDQIFSNSNKLY